MKKSFQHVIATLNLFQGKQSLAIFLLAAIFALSACDDSSSAGGDDNNVILSGDSREESSDSRSNDKDEAISSSGKVTDKDSDSMSSDSKSNDPAEVTDDSSDSKGNPSSVGTSTKSSNSSSSSVTPSDVEGSSKTAWDYLNPDINYGEFTDERDGQVYKTVKIGDQVWMAQNLNYAYIDVPYNFSYNNNVYIYDSTSWCYLNGPANCAKYGRLYTWAAAMDSVGEWSTNGKGCGYGKTCSPTYPVRGICPKGWHLPSYSEWKTLFEAVGKSTADVVLKSQVGWYSSSGNGTDAFGFSALPAGYRYNGGHFDYDGYKAYFWSSEGFATENAFYMSLSDYGTLHDNSKERGSSVRCIKDSE